MHAFVPNFKFRDVRQDGSLKMAIGEALNVKEIGKCYNFTFYRARPSLKFQPPSSERMFPATIGPIVMTIPKRLESWTSHTWER